MTSCRRWGSIRCSVWFCRVAVFVFAAIAYVASVQDVAWQLLHARSHKGQQTADVSAVARRLTGFSDVQDIYHLTEDRPDTADVLSDAVLQSFASPLLGPCQVQYLDLTAQRGINMGIAALASGRFPGWKPRFLSLHAPTPSCIHNPFLCMFLLPHAESPRLSQPTHLGTAGQYVPGAQVVTWSMR